MLLTERVARMGPMRNVKNIKSRKDRHDLESLDVEWGSITVEFWETDSEGAEWIHVAQDVVQWRIIMNTAM